jgi:Ni/Co efflux regulator RcnB
MMRRWFVAGLVIALPLAPAAPARADHDDEHGKHWKQGDQGDDDAQGDHQRHFTSREREVVHVYFADEQRRGHCPPGLAKKHDGCLSPGHAKRHYVIGRPMPAGVVLVPVPAELVVRMGPPPSGCRYAMVDGDVVKLAAGSALVIDAIRGLAN